MGKREENSGNDNPAAERRSDSKQGIPEISGRQTERIRLDAWQQEVVDYQGNICLRAGRQVGKSTAIAVKVCEYSSKNPKKSVMIISHTERQAYLLFSKILGYLFDHYKTWIRKGKDRPTKSEIKLTNGTVIRCLPTGLDGIGIRGYTVDLLIADEAAFIPEDVWAAVTPMLATTKGAIILLSTPKGIGNFFYECYHNPAFKTWHISSEDCSRISKDFLEHEKKMKTKLVYMQEYQGEFTENLRQLFPDKLIKECMTLERDNAIYTGYYMGVDVARMGGDECTFEIGRKIEEQIYHSENFVTENILIPDTINKILEFDKIYKFNKIYIDTGGMGIAVFDFLLRNDQTRGKVVEINNAQRPIEKRQFGKDGERRKTLMKEHLYMNLKRLMEQHRIKLLKDENIFFSLKSIQCEVDENTKGMKIFGTYTHIAEGLIRMAWCSQEKDFNIWVRAV